MRMRMGGAEMKKPAGQIFTHAHPESLAPPMLCLVRTGSAAFVKSVGIATVRCVHERRVTEFEMSCKPWLVLLVAVTCVSGNSS